MFRAILIFVAAGLAAPGSPASAKPAAAPGWQKLEVLPEGTIYIDPASIRRSGSSADMWVLIDYTQPQPDRTGKSIRSDKLHYRYDCAGRQESIVTSAAYAGAMATGVVVDTNTDPPRLTPVGPGTTAEVMLKRACGTAG